MRTRPVVLLALIGCTPVDAPATSRNSEAPPVILEPDPTPAPTPSNPAVTCIARYELGSKSVLDEQRRRGGANRWSDFATRYRAATIDPTTHHAVEVVSGYHLGDAKLLWFTPDFADAVVDATVLGDLKIVNATGLRVGEREEIGVLTELGRTKLRGRELTEFLLKSDTIGTYVHIGSTMCLIAETDEADGYRAELTGEHEYYTNEENHDPLAFSLEITSDGRITITGVQPTPLPAASFSSQPVSEPQ